MLRNGDTTAKARPSDVVGPHRMGIGAPTGLAGEIVVLDGETWVSQPDAQRGHTTRHPAPAGTTATFLALATVPGWADRRTTQRLTLPELERVVRAAAVKAGPAPGPPLPFLIDGRFLNIRLHILNGRCPFAHDRVVNDPSHDPVRLQAPKVGGVLVGFYNDHAPGSITHAGTHVHIHALLRDAATTVGHVDAVTVEPGAVIRLPVLH